MSADGCACPRRDARGCYRYRHKLDMREAMGSELTSASSEEECSCSCHEEEEDDEDSEFARAADDADAWLDELREVF